MAENETSDVTVDENGILQFQIEPDPETAEYDLLVGIADREDLDIDDLPPLYTVVDDFVGSMFDDPPSAAAQMEVSFSYAGYRVTVTQDGHATLVPVKESVEEVDEE